MRRSYEIRLARCVDGLRGSPDQGQEMSRNPRDIRQYAPQVGQPCRPVSGAGRRLLISLVKDHCSYHAMRYTMHCMVTTERVLTSLRKGLVEFCVLAILRDGSTYGLEMARRLESDGLIAGESTLYPLLARLLANGLAESQWSESEAGRPRKYYTLTAEGREALDIFEQSWVPLRNAVDRTLRRPS